MSNPPRNITGYTEINQNDLKDPSLSLLNALLKNSAQAVGTVQQQGSVNTSAIAALSAQIALLQKEIEAIGQPTAASALSASGISAKGQAQQALNAVSSLGTAGASALPVSSGGTGQKTLTKHGVVIGQGTGGVSVIAPGSAGQVLTSTGSSSNPDFEDAQLLGASGIGNGSDTNLQAPARGTGTGPVSMILVSWVQVKVNGTNYYIGLFQ